MSSHPETLTSSDIPNQRISRWRGVLRLALVAILILLAIRLLAGYIVQTQLKRAGERVTAAGESLRYLDFAPPDIAIGDNATEFLEAAGNLMTAGKSASSGSPPIEDLSHQRLREIDHARLQVTSEDLELFRQAVDHHALVLQVLDEGMSRERARFDVNYSSRTPATLDIPNLLRRMKLGGLMRARVQLAIDGDRPDDAWREVAKIFRMAGWLAEEMPTLIHSIVAQAIARQGLEAAHDVLQVAPPSTETAAMVLAQARRWDPRAVHARSLEAERAAIVSTLRYKDGWRELVGAIPPARLDLGPWPLDVSYEGVLMSWPFRPWVDWNITVYIEAMTRQIEACEPPAYQRPLNLENLFGEHFWPSRWAVLARQALPNMLESCAKRDSLVAGLDLMEIAFRLAEHRQETSRYPPDLNNLENVPTLDPFSGEPYRYRREAGGAMVYSVAGNRADDGGTPPVSDGTRPAPELDTGDLVWYLPAAP